MKRILLALTMLTGFGASSQVAKADVSVDFFYNNLSGGNWIEVGDYGYCWQPDVAVSNTDWRPYADGYWAYTDEGWTWVSYEDHGWATYHYGRWANLHDQGWVWVPGRNEDLEWGPAWVSWRTGDQYVGWAPLPPNGQRFDEGRGINGHVDIDFDIGPAYYNFVDVRYIGEPVLRERIIASGQNVTYINQTVNVTNITYKNKTVYNYGPDINVINQRASRPIQRLTIQRDSNVDYAAVGRSGGFKTKVQGQSLIVAGPTHIGRSTQQLAPPTVKTKIAKANLDGGWAGVGDAKAKEQFKQKLRREDTSKIPQAPAAGANSQAAVGVSPSGANAQVGTSATGPGPAASVAASATTQVERGGKHNRNKPVQPIQQNAATGSSPALAASPAQTGASAATDANAGFERGKGGKHKNRQGEQNATGTVGMSPATAASVPANGSPVSSGPATDVTSGHKGRHAEQLQTAPARAEATTPATSAEGATGAGATGQGGGGKHNRRDQNVPAAEGQLQGQPNNGASDVQGQGQGERKARRLEQQAPSASNPSEPMQGGGGKHRGQGERQEASGQPADAAGEARQGQGGKKNKVEASPSPVPQ